MADEIGEDKDILHEHFKKRFIGVETFSIFGQTETRGVTTTTLNTGEFTQYLDKIQQFASIELGVVLPNPGDLVFQEFEEYYKNRL